MKEAGKDRMREGKGEKGDPSRRRGRGERGPDVRIDADEGHAGDREGERASRAACVTSEAPGGISQPPQSRGRTYVRPRRATDGERSTDDDDGEMSGVGERGGGRAGADGGRNRVFSRIPYTLYHEGKDGRAGGPSGSEREAARGCPPALVRRHSFH